MACYFIKNSGHTLAHATAALVRALDVDSNDVATQKRITARLEPFVDAVLPNRTLRISIGGQEEQTLGPSSHSGISAALSVPPLAMYSLIVELELIQAISDTNFTSLPPRYQLAP